MRYMYLIIICFQALFLAGCSSGRLCDCKPLNELGALPDENGTAVNQWLCRQTENAQHGKGVIYQADWVGTSARLGPFGKKRLGTWSALSGLQPNLYVETSGDPFLDSQRQAAVSGYLNQIGIAMSPESIQLADVDSGLTGEEVPAIADRFLGELNGSAGTNAGSQGGFLGGGQSGGFF